METSENALKSLTPSKEDNINNSDQIPEEKNSELADEAKEYNEDSVAEGSQLLPLNKKSCEETYFHNGLNITNDCFGFYPKAETNELEMVKRFTFSTINRMSVEVITYGATITSIKVPDKFGVAADVLLGYDTLEDCMNQKKPQLGSVFDWANSLRNFPFNCGRVNWTPFLNLSVLTLTHISEVSTEGQMNTVFVSCSFEVKNDNSLRISFDVNTAFPLFLNLSSTLFFNLNCHSADAAALYDHILTINSEKCQSASEDDVQSVHGTALDLRTSIRLGAAISRNDFKGFDHNFVVTKYTGQRLAYVCRVFNPKSGRSLEIYSDQPLVHFNTANQWAHCRAPNSNFDETLQLITDRFKMLTVKTGESVIGIDPRRTEEIGQVDENSKGGGISFCDEIVGKGGAIYKMHGSFSMNPLRYNDKFQCTDNSYTHVTVYKFGIPDVHNKCSSKT